MPFVSPALLTKLATSSERLVVPSAGGRLHPLLARYEAELLEPLRAALAAQRPLQEVVAELDPRLIEEHELGEFGEPARLLFNVNDRADLAEAERLLAAADG
jgi:molybdopterin-guanine dinucleotide biosynthesis protein A